MLSTFGIPQVDALSVQLTGVIISTLRILPIFVILPIFSFASLRTGFLRGGVIFSISLFFVPLTLADLGAVQNPPASLLSNLTLVPKEVFIGICMGSILSVPFWIASAIGNFLDTQSGEQLGGIVDPNTGEDTTGNGTFIFILFTLVFLESDFMMTVFVHLVSKSFEVWPISEHIPRFSSDIVVHFTHLLGNLLLGAAALFLPYSVGLILIDVSLAYVSKFVPSISPLFLSMGGKVGFSIIFSIIYHQYLVQYMVSMLFEMERAFDVIGMQ